MHAIAFDAVHDEVVLPQIFAQGILFFRGGVNGEEAPIRYIQGSLTKLQDPDHVDVDPVHNEIYVPQHGYILTFPRDADGNVAPIRILGGPDTGMGGGDQGVVVDPVHNLLIVSDYSTKGGSKILIFNRTDQGNVRPKAVIGGPKSGLNTHDVHAAFAVYPPKGEIIISVSGRSTVDPGIHGTDTEVEHKDSYVGVWSINDNGDIPPHWTFGGPNGAFRNVNGLTIDPKHKEVIVTDMGLNAVMTFYSPEIF